MLQTIDMFWVEHLEMMDYLRGSVNLRAYGQRDPLVEYRKEGLKLFREMEISITNQVLDLIPKIQVGIAVDNGTPKELKEVHENVSAITKGNQNSNVIANSNEPKVGRNDPCHCGSGKKYKKCHGK
jgi:preprotein translocase subunit SecA